MSPSCDLGVGLDESPKETSLRSASWDDAPLRLADAAEIQQTPEGSIGSIGSIESHKSIVGRADDALQSAQGWRHTPAKRSDCAWVTL